MITKKYKIVKPKDTGEWPEWIPEMDPLDGKVIEHNGSLDRAWGLGGGTTRVKLYGSSYLIHHSWLVPCSNLTLIRKVRL